ncbi:enoyl-CoA hydratase/isomerase family protein [Aneurinibacillus aneurinilyticus]|uniref:Enoyl-CoA hydratase/isomerase family protein n=1 Tax=Aneurinibacillus aneurinilyticus ATCC 12856 TaxID=649747 RepID=U1WR98_ANEAE|nr:enoyl-CoA hydratase/isomerase family protein [Aneurinibacillus aneurinilyticus]ERI11149.1 enoyl-CoA hydratase/isomerase family protein [Aneurinibacillus aneurinilyticus ATCC 12856]MED0704859.1 enoyl-CoA hydratase/isomerase family protein [Aneurinibacillus aneurinilyticus]MED0723817.1 enoyl-CoA hydratase/isomerase family protein [Aneurinibacillus aneurinilyticus]MED0731110.1 enoyl-CoA hydratase/isomerase family protein [Aneurinibacillus aneurinilyticus]MED0740622.1 enoyl-CoA hydratase/isomer
MKVETIRFEDGAKIVWQETAGLAIVTIKRPWLKNAMTPEMWKALADIGRKIEKNEKIKTVILRGEGKQFTVGSDIKAFNRMSIEEANEAFVVMEDAITSFEYLRIPTIAFITGPSMGAGLELALSCDLRVGSPDALLGIPIGKLGITISQRFSQRLVNLIGPSRTKDLIFTGRLFKAEEAYDLGLLNYLFDGDNADAFVLDLAQRISYASMNSLQAAKEAVARCVPFTEVAFGHRGYPQYIDPIDFPEGVAAFVEKREPRFGRLT